MPPTVLIRILPACLGVWLACFGVARGEQQGEVKALSADQIGAELRKLTAGEGMSVQPTSEGARLRAVTQDLEGEVTSEGLWLQSTSEEEAGESHRFRLRAVEVGRGSDQSSAISDQLSVDARGVVQAAGDMVRLVRAGLVEEYSVSADGVRQDFVVLKRPVGGDDLVVALEASGAKVEPAAYGVKLTLEGTGRELAYSRLLVTDATGRKLPARMEVVSAYRVHIIVDDESAVYPVRIDPTYSDADWISMGGVSGTNNTVSAIAADGAGNVYIGGNFTTVGDVPANFIAKWNGSSWSAMGAGMNAGVNALLAVGSNVYAGGSFTTAGGVAARRIARWNGTTWSTLGTGMNGLVEVLAISGSTLYAGGSFTTADDLPANRIAKWNGSAWSALGAGVGHTIYALGISGSNVYVGGSFVTAGGNPANRVAMWNGSTWSALGTGLNGAVQSLVISGSDVFVGGAFTTAGGATANRVAKWDGSAWSALGTGMDGAVNALVLSGSDLYAGGSFTMADASSAEGVAKWDGSAWTGLDTGTNGSVVALAISGGELYVGGTFTAAGGLIANRIAKWNGSAWAALASGGGLNGVVHALAVGGGNLYVAGEFTTAGNISAIRIARWDGGTWSALGTGMNDAVYALAVSGSDLYAGGNFTTAGGVAADRIAKWDGSAWSAMGTGMDGTVSALAVTGSEVYAGGSFTTAGGVSAARVAKWDGASWSALGTGVNASVNVLMVSGSDLYAGGNFTTAGGGAANRVARWNGSGWLPFGNGLNGTVNALAVSGSDLFAGGSFTMSGTTAVNRIARWNGSTWSALGSGMDNNVNALVISASDLFAAGAFATAGGTAASRVARWDGSTWSAVGSGVNNSIQAFAASNGDVYVGGTFVTAGNSVSAYVTRLKAPSTLLTLNGATLIGTTTARLNGTVNPNGLETTAYFEYGPDTNYGSTASVTLTPDDGVVTQSVNANLSGLTPGTLYHFRLTSSNTVGLSHTNDGTFTTLSTNADLSNLVPSAGTLDPVFDSGTTNYTVGVANTTTSITITPTAAGPGATIRVNNVVVVSGNASGAISLAVGQNTINTVVTAQDGVTTRTYTLVVTRAPSSNANLSNLTSTAGAFSPTFSSAITSYTANVANTTTSVTVTPTVVAGAGATVKVNSVTVSSGAASAPISLLVGDNSIITEVTAQDGVTIKTYTLVVTRAMSSNANLSSLLPSSGTLSPVFSANTTSYAATVSNTTASITLTPTVAEPNATVTVNGTTVTSGTASDPIPLAIGPNAVSILVTAQNGTLKSYGVNVTRTPLPGAIAIDLPAGTVLQINEEDGPLAIPIIRSGGSDGTVGFSFVTTNGTAAANNDFTAPTVLQSMADGVTTLSVLIPILSPGTDEANETFTVSLASPTGGATLGAVKSVTVRIVDTVDTTAPFAPVISTPVANAVLNVASTAPMTVSGTASDNKGVGSVKVKLNSGTFVDAVLASRGAVTTSYTATVSGTVGGTNTITAQTFDTRGLGSPEATRNFTATRLLTVNVEASLGSVTAGFAGSTNRELGKSYTITATAKAPTTTPFFAGAIFMGWTLGGQDVGNGNAAFTPQRLGTVASALEKASLTFIYREGLELTANFVPNPFALVAGTYHGLIRPSAELPDRAPLGGGIGVEDGTSRSNATEGRFTATVQKTGAFSATLTIDGLALVFSGAFDGNGDARFGTARLLTQTVPRAGKPSLKVALQLDPDTQGTHDKITGTVTATGFQQSVIVAVSTIESDRAYYNGTTLPAPAAYLGPSNANGVYTVILPAKDATEQPVGLTERDYPRGTGTAFLTLSKAGVVTVTGTLADKTGFSLSSALSQANTFPFFAQLYNKLGFVSGMAELDSSDPDSDMAAPDLQWLRPFQATSHYYPYGWPEVIKVDLLAAKYGMSSGQSVLKAPNGAALQAADGDGNVSLSFSEGQLSETLNKFANLSVLDAVTKVPGNDPTFTLTIVRTTGAFSGMFDHTDDTKPTYSGVIYQKGAWAGGHGFFMTKQPVVIDYTGESGGVMLLGQP